MYSELVRASISRGAEGSKLPSPFGVTVVWLISLIAVVAASFGMLKLALAFRDGWSGTARELQPSTLSPILSDPRWFIGGAVATQGTVALVLALTLWLGRLDRALVLPFARPPAVAFLGALLVVFGLAPLAQTVGELMSRLLNVELKASLIVSAMAKRSNPAEFAVLLFSLAAVPAIVEEAMFRGYVTAAYAGRSLLAAALLPSLLFGIFHLEPTQAAGTVVLGIGFALARLYTASLAPGMLAHCVYNAAVLTTARVSTSPDDHEIRAMPLLVGSALFAFGFFVLRRVSVACTIKD